MATTLSRRRLLQSLALVGTTACGIAGCRGATPTSAKSGSTARGAAAGAAGIVLTRRLERATFGVTPALRAEVERAGGFGGWIDRQLAGDLATGSPERAALLARIDERLPSWGELAAGSKEDRKGVGGLCLQTIVGRTVVGAAFGADQLRQRVVGVLADLLHVTSSSRKELLGICDYDRVLRDGAFGRFSDLLVATAQHPAMLVFLDQATSRADGGRIPNENYAREVMELHTVGVDGGYDEGDVKELSHVLSGWSIDRRTRRFVFRDAWHDLGAFASSGDILGWRPAASQTGEAAGVAALRHLASHPATARRLAHLLARNFVSETLEADDPLVVEAAEIYRTHDTAIGPVVRHLLTSDRFERDATLMLRRPIDLVAHALRVSAAPADGDLEATLTATVGLTRVLGQVPYAWPAPNGYPFGSAAWSNAGAMLGRWNAITTLAGWGAPEVRRFAFTLDPSTIGAADPAGWTVSMCSPAHQLV